MVLDRPRDNRQPATCKPQSHSHVIVTSTALSSVKPRYIPCFVSLPSQEETTSSHRRTSDLESGLSAAASQLGKCRGQPPDVRWPFQLCRAHGSGARLFAKKVCVEKHGVDQGTDPKPTPFLESGWVCTIRQAFGLAAATVQDVVGGAGVVGGCRKLAGCVAD